MKKLYEQPWLEVTRFEVEDIVTASSDDPEKETLDKNELPPYATP